MQSADIRISLAQSLSRKNEVVLESREPEKNIRERSKSIAYVGEGDPKTSWQFSSKLCLLSWIRGIAVREVWIEKLCGLINLYNKKFCPDCTRKEAESQISWRCFELSGDRWWRHHQNNGIGMVRSSKILFLKVETIK